MTDRMTRMSEPWLSARPRRSRGRRWRCGSTASSVATGRRFCASRDCSTLPARRDRWCCTESSMSSIRRSCSRLGRTTTRPRGSFLSCRTSIRARSRNRSRGCWVGSWFCAARRSAHRPEPAPALAFPASFGETSASIAAAIANRFLSAAPGPWSINPTGISPAA